MTVGISLGVNELRLVKVGQGPDKNRVLLNYETISYPAQVSPKSPQFLLFLKRTLTQFCRESKAPEIWSAISSAKVEMRYLRIPKVPRKQIANTVYWTFKRDVSFDEKGDIFDFSLLGDVIEEGVQKTEVMAYTAPRDEVNRLRDLFAKSGFPLTGITIVPFLLQNLLRSRWLGTEVKSACSLYIGTDWSRIDIFSNGNLVLSRGIKAGMQSMIESLRQHIAGEEPTHQRGEKEEPFPAEPPAADLAALPEADEARRIFFGFIQHPQYVENSPVHKFTETDIFNMILPALERLIRQVERTLEHYALKFENIRVERVYLSGPVNTQQLMVDHIAEQLGTKIDIFDPMGEASPLSDNITPPESRYKREAFLPAVGLALSDGDQTPNFLRTYRDKQKASKNRQINSLLFAALLLVMVACGAVYFWQSEQIDEKEMKVFALQRELDSFAPRVDRDLIALLLQKVKKGQDSMKGVGHRYKPVAVINEISRLTPAHVRLLSLSLDMDPTAGDPSRRLVRIEGVVFGERLTYESLLAEFLVKLQTSPLLNKFSIQQRTFAFVEEKEVLRFTAQMEIG
ncbi:MAG: pilus assembly protein PilM [Desulfobacterales bacterium]|nr:pilus assembly protein PilM [Desulfobacterales bacterium]